jgi:hypothetical protein
MCDAHCHTYPRADAESLLADLVAGLQMQRDCESSLVSELKRIEAAREGEGVDQILIKTQLRKYHADRQVNATKLKSLEKGVQLVSRGCQYIGTAYANLADRTSGKAIQLNGSSSSLVILPRIIPRQVGVSILLRTTKGIEDGVLNYLLERYQHSLASHREVYNELWRAPIEAVDDHGQILPLPPHIEEELLIYQARNGKVAVRPPKAHVAWQWLIISHNAQPHVAYRVSLHRKLRASFGGLQNRVRKPDAQHQQERRPSQPPPKGEGSSIGMSTSADSDEEKFPAAGSAGTSFDVEAATTDNPLPLSIEEDGQVFVPISRGELTGNAPWGYSVRVFFVSKLDSEGNEVLGAYIGDKKPIGASARMQDTIVLPDEPAKKVVKFTTPKAANASPRPGAEAKKGGKVSKGRKGQRGNPLRVVPADADPVSGEGEQKTEPPGQRSPANPLRIKAVPRSEALSEEDKASLRGYFHVESEPIDPAVWDAMSKQDKTASRKARSIPRWAVAAVLHSPSNLARVLRGDLTKENFVGVVRSANDSKSEAKGSPPRAQSNAVSAWVKLKEKFPGTSLLARPQTRKEKSFLQGYNNLVSEFGPLKCFPRPKEGRGEAPGKGGRALNPSNGRRSPGDRSPDDFGRRLGKALSVLMGLDANPGPR